VKERIGERLWNGFGKYEASSTRSGAVEWVYIFIPLQLVVIFKN